MENMEEKIMSVLNDPEKMSQIFDIAQNLGLSAKEDMEDIPSLPDENVLSGLFRMFQSGENSKQEALVEALLPYLRPGRQEKLQKALKLSRLSHLAGIALKQYSETN